MLPIIPSEPRLLTELLLLALGRQANLLDHAPHKSDDVPSDIGPSRYLCRGRKISMSMKHIEEGLGWVSDESSIFYADQRWL